MSALWTSAEAAKATGGAAAGPWEAHGVSIDSRTVKPGDLFVALEGPNRDGHGFVAMALEKGAAAALVARGVEGADPARLLVVKDTQAGLEALGAAARARTGARVCAVTGSVGKTSTKEALRHVLSAQGATHASEASYNNLWGVPLTLARMPAATRFGVFEIGMNHADEIRPLVAQVKPHAAIVTTVEAVHLENFPNIEGIADAKAEIFEGLREGGLAIINADNAFAARLAASAKAQGARIRSYGEHGEEAKLLSVALAPGHSDVEARVLGRTLTFRYGAPGRHLVQNALGVLLMVDALGGDVEAAAASFASIEAVKGRGQRVTVAIPGGTFELIDESYNANPASMAAALALLGQSQPGPSGRRIAVLGDMLELGPESASMHAGLNAPVASAKADLAFASGPMMAHLWAALPVGIRGAYGPSSQDIAAAVAEAMRPGDVVMVKGSLGSRMAIVVDALKARGLRSGPA
jgi:UDP-N-acetylmuramoyl-tripeptide--D-alanyl-D-alanine ligase